MNIGSCESDDVFLVLCPLVVNVDDSDCALRLLVLMRGLNLLWQLIELDLHWAVLLLCAKILVLLLELLEFLNGLFCLADERLKLLFSFDVDADESEPIGKLLESLKGLQFLLGANEGKTAGEESYAVEFDADRRYGVFHSSNNNLDIRCWDHRLELLHVHGTLITNDSLTGQGGSGD